MSILENKTVFVAGGSGMAGRAIINEILKNYKAVKIRAAVFSQGDFCFVNERVEVVRGDLRDPEECRRMCSGFDFAIMAVALDGRSETQCQLYIFTDKCQFKYEYAVTTGISRRKDLRGFF